MKKTAILDYGPESGEDDPDTEETDWSSANKDYFIENE